MTSGSTRTAGVIGWPVRHSLSPVIHGAAFAATGLDWAYLAFPVAPGDAPAAIEGMRALGIEGLSVTMPHKTSVAALVDRTTADATALGAVNCVFRDGDDLVGDNTDGAGFVDSLRSDEDLDPAGMHCVVFGAGGAARAVVRALAAAGADRVSVVNRRADRAETAAALAGDRGVVAETKVIGDADLIVNATPLGMGDDRSVPFHADSSASGAVIVDLVYHPAVTPLLAAATGAERRTIGGLGMLVHQAARAFERWTGTAAPTEAMSAAARDALG